MSKLTWPNLPTSFPEIYDNVLGHLDHSDLLALRLTNLSFDQGVNKYMFRHIVLIFFYQSSWNDKLHELGESSEDGDPEQRLEEALLKEVLDHSIDCALPPSPDYEDYGAPDILLHTPAGKRLPACREWLNENSFLGQMLPESHLARLKILLRYTRQCDIFGTPSGCFEIEDVFAHGASLPLVRCVNAETTQIPADLGIYFTRLQGMATPVATVPRVPCAARHVVNVSFLPHYDDLANGNIDFDLFVQDPPVDLIINFQNGGCRRHRCRNGCMGEDQGDEDDMDQGRNPPLGVLTSLVHLLRTHPSTRVTMIGIEALPPRAIPALVSKQKTIPEESFAALIDLLKTAVNEGGAPLTGSLRVLTSEQYCERVGEKTFEFETVTPTDA
ncbi:hypothetical protein CspHIS471_0211280 [Cutaneotrichosporon sp. HIS471]|nr:hypothetical protein CspHIS471_0211280 [Cutaneotrichosporon sp. HIS471]